MSKVFFLLVMPVHAHEPAAALAIEDDLILGGIRIDAERKRPVGFSAVAVDWIAADDRRGQLDQQIGRLQSQRWLILIGFVGI
jgi:hypothetical protein